ncbi:MAG: GDSL-type esterase/lipase family protein [Pseudomonadales bacterium]
MTTFKMLAIAVLVLVLISAGLFAYYAIKKSRGNDPLVWESDIKALEEKLVSQPAKEGAILFIGSSSIRFWDSIAEDMKPFDVVQRGFGGAKLLDVVHYGQRLIEIGVTPSAIVVFAGTNDIHPGAVKKPALLLQRYQQFIDVVRVKYIDVPVYYIAITPSPMRWEVWNVAQQTNKLIREYSAAENNLFVIDTGAKLLGEDGEPNPDFYIFDGLHLSDKGYAEWTKMILPRLLEDLRPAGG